MHRLNTLDKDLKSNEEVELQHIPNINGSSGPTELNDYNGYNSYVSFDENDNDNEKINFKTFQIGDNNEEKDMNIDIEPDIENGRYAQNNNNNYNNSGPWNKRIRLLLKKIGERSMGYKWMHFQEFQHYEWMNYFFVIFELVILTILGALTSGQFIGIVADIGLKDNTALVATISALQLLFLVVYGIVKGIREVGNYPQLIFEHKYNSTKYSKINLDIQHQFSLNLEDRDTDKEFLNNILATYNGQLFESPKIRKSTMDRYAKKTKDYKIFKPIDVGDFDTIEIVIDDGFTNNVGKITKTSRYKTTDDKYNHEIDRWLQNF